MLTFTAIQRVHHKLRSGGRKGSTWCANFLHQTSGGDLAPRWYHRCIQHTHVGLRWVGSVLWPELRSSLRVGGCLFMAAHPPCPVAATPSPSPLPRENPHTPRRTPGVSSSRGRLGMGAVPPPRGLDDCILAAPPHLCIITQQYTHQQHQYTVSSRGSDARAGSDGVASLVQSGLSVVWLVPPAFCINLGYSVAAGFVPCQLQTTVVPPTHVIVAVPKVRNCSCVRPPIAKRAY